MLNCIVADLVNQLRNKNKFGICTKSVEDLLCTAAAYKWLMDNADYCLTECQLDAINKFINLWPTAYTECIEITTNCVELPLPANDDCSTAKQEAYIDTNRPIYIVTGQRNDRVCPTLEYPSDSGLPLPASWDPDSNGDIWYKFNTGFTPILKPYIYVRGGSIQVPQMAIYRGTCGSPTLVAHSQGIGNSAELNPTLSINTDYFVRISNSNGTVNAGTFDFIISLLPLQ
jgi:hypothetical protein